MSVSHPKISGSWLMVCGFALGVAVGTPSGNASAPPDTAVKASAAIPPQKASSPGKVSAKAAKPGKPIRSGKPRMGTPGKMQVAEPKAGRAPAADGGSKAWQVSHAKGLTEEQKQAFRDRKDRMQNMMALIKEKRMAMRDAEPERRAALAKELHNLILEEEGQGQAASSAARTAPEPAGEKGGAGGQRRKQAEFRQLQMEKRKEEMRKEEIRKLQIERLRHIQESKAASDWENRKGD